MGYTHYFTNQKMQDEHLFKEFTANVQKLVDNSPCALRVEFNEPETVPYITDHAVKFNGLGDEGHETFWYTRTDTDFQFCKTAYKPYDLIVVAVLALANYYFGDDIRISSDGGKGDWEAGIAYARKVTGLEIVCPKLVHEE